MGILALVLGIFTIVIAFIPIVNIIGIFTGIAALIIGIIDLILKQNKRQKGWGKSLAAIILSVCAMWIIPISLIITCAFIGYNYDVYDCDYGYNYYDNYNYNYEYDNDFDFDNIWEELKQEFKEDLKNDNDFKKISYKFNF